LAGLCVIRDGALPGAENMRRDAELLRDHVPGQDPVLRVYRWAPPAVSVGRNQEGRDFAAGVLADRGYDLVRRPTGGRAILHAEELTYAVVGSSPSALFGDSLHQTYEAINRALLLFLQGLGVAADVAGSESRASRPDPVCFRSTGRHEVRVGGRKLIGSAQRRTGGVFLQHGSILTGPAHTDLVDLLDQEDPGRCPREELLAATTDLGRLLGRRPDPADLAELGDRLVAAFCTALGLEPTT